MTVVSVTGESKSSSFRAKCWGPPVAMARSSAFCSARPIQLFRSRPLIPLPSLMAARVWLPSSSAKLSRFF
jgi:hypothetical protein